MSLIYLQKEKVSEYRDKWTGIYLSTEPANREEAEKFSEQMYAAAKLTAPTEIHWVLSPTQALALADDMTINVGNIDRKEFQYHQDNTEKTPAFFEFCLEVMGEKAIIPLISQIEFVKNAEFIIPFIQMMIICDRPKKRTVLDNDDVIVEYRDGTIGQYETMTRSCMNFGLKWGE